MSQIIRKRKIPHKFDHERYGFEEIPIEIAVGDICIRGSFDFIYFEEHYWSEYHYYRRRGLFGKEEVNEFEERVRRLTLRR